MGIGALVHHPVDPLLQACAFDRPTGGADGRQHGPRPVLRTALVERTPQPPGRCADERDMAGLPRAVAPLALSQAPRLRTGPRQRRGACPAVPIPHPQAHRLPHQPMTHQGVARLCLVAVLPQPAHPYGLGDLGQPQRLPAVPGASVAHPDRWCGRPGPLARHGLQGWCPSVIPQGPMALPLPHRRPCGALPVVQPLGTCDRAVTGAVARAAAPDGRVEPRDTPREVVRALPLLARGFFLAPSPVQGSGRSRRADSVGAPGIMGADRPLVGMVPAPAHGCDPLARMVHQGLGRGPSPLAGGGASWAPPATTPRGGR